MSKMQADIQKIVHLLKENKIGTTISVCFLLMVLVDLILSNFFPFWLFPLLIGLITGIIWGSAKSGLFSAVGVMNGRFIYTIVAILTTPGYLKTGDLFLAAIGNALDISIPLGSMIIIFLSIINVGLLSLAGGALGGSGIQIYHFFTSSES